ncbi:profilin-3-like [Apus apus]|uniref:profilin-3-like n=1 Tax=Apus apus TaxID=8895 RepID=UPI0021F8DD54|nr:profilin-3-like [Apus apus]
MDLSDKTSVLVAKAGEFLTAISPQEVDLITGQDQKMFLLMGITTASQKCSVINYNLLVGEHNMIGVRSKGSDSRSICVGKTSKALIFLMGNKEVHGGVLNQNAQDMIVDLKV